MAIKNRTVEILGDQARVASIQIYPKADNGDATIIAVGQTVDSEGRKVALKEAQIEYTAGANEAMASLLVLCLGALRKVNGLEDAALPLEPKPEPETLPAEPKSPAEAPAEPTP